MADVPPVATPCLGAGCAGICIKFGPVVQEDPAHHALLLLLQWLP